MLNSDSIETVASICQDTIKSGRIFVLYFRLVDEISCYENLNSSELDTYNEIESLAIRKQFFWGRSLLRNLLECPEQPILKSVYGKPYIVGYPSFSISHSGDFLVIAVSSNGSVGVDIEVCRKIESFYDLLDYVCHPNEKKEIYRSHHSNFQKTFLRCWTRKEAVLKAIGSGIDDNLHLIDTQIELDIGCLSGTCGMFVRNLSLDVPDVVCALAFFGDFSSDCTIVGLVTYPPRLPHS